MEKKNKGNFSISLINQCQTEFFTVISRSGELGRNNKTRTNSNRAYNASNQKNERKNRDKKKHRKKKTRSDSCCCPPTDNDGDCGRHTYTYTQT